MDSDKIIVIVLLVVVAFGAGLTLGLLRYKIPTDLRNRIDQEARSNYRDFDEHIAFIISKYYEEVGKWLKNKKPL